MQEESKKIVVDDEIKNFSKKYKLEKDGWELNPKSRFCPTCNKELFYKNKSCYKKACEKNTKCNSCCLKKEKLILRKTCLDCGVEIIYKTKVGYNTTTPLCRPCIHRRNSRNTSTILKYYNLKLNGYEYHCSRCQTTVFLKSVESIRNCVKTNLCGNCRTKNYNYDIKQKFEKIQLAKRELKIIQSNRKKELKLKTHELSRLCKECGSISKLTRLHKKNPNYLCKKCRVLTPEYKKKMSEKFKLLWKDPTYRKSLTDCQLRDDVRLRKREKMVNKIKERYGKASYNPKACQIIDQINLKTGLNLRHALNGGEKIVNGYFLDGYDEVNRVVFEFDEPQHYYADGTLRSNDQKRQNDIIGHFNKMDMPILKFIRYDEKRNRMYEVLTGKEILYGKKKDVCNGRTEEGSEQKEITEILSGEH